MNSPSTFKHSRIGRLPNFVFFRINLWSKISGQKLYLRLKQCYKCLTGAFDVCRLQIKKLHHSFLIVSVVLSQFIKFLMEKSVMVQLWGKQVVEKKPVNKAAKKGKDTKAIMRKETVKQKVRKTIRQEW